MEPGDTFELSEDGLYTSTHNEERFESDDRNSTVSSRYTSNYSISQSYAEMLKEAGYLEEIDNNNKSGFVNVFDEISNMIEAYKEELGNIDEDMANEPACLKIEKETVLRNLITMLEHLNSLKK